MPYATMKVPAGTLTPEQKKHAVEAITDLYAGFYGDQARSNVLVLVEEVADGGWGIGGQILTKAMLDGR